MPPRLVMSVDPDLLGYVLRHHDDLRTPAECAATTLALLAQKATRAGVSFAPIVARHQAAAPEGARALADLGTEALERAISERILRERAAEVWPNVCPRCGALCRTPYARVCPACSFSWFDTPKLYWHILRASPRWDRCADRALCHQVPGVGLVVAVADGAGNSRSGASAAESVMRHVRSYGWTAEGDEWELQELLMGVDAELAGTGGETTAAVGVFGAGGWFRAAAAGDTRVFARSGTEPWILPATRNARLGTGSAVPATFAGKVTFPVYFASDGAWAGGFDPLHASLRAHPSGTRPWIEQQQSLSGDDATLIEVTDPNAPI